jgi:hypothetical protein
MYNEYGIRNNEKRSGTDLIATCFWRNQLGPRDIWARRVGDPGKLRMSPKPATNQHKSDALPLQQTCSVLPEKKFSSKRPCNFKTTAYFILSRHSEYGPGTTVLTEICFRLISTYNYGSRVQLTSLSYHYSSERAIHKRTHFLFSIMSD